ncbi:DUF378 domain-containing protein [Candidatus Woesearchaeota archaeon]|nr:DUF378 domain-containing protein [Candidatus Woesearchaeota archaeon]
MAEKSTIQWISWILLLVGGINWGLVGTLQWNLVSAIFGSIPWLERILYILVGLSALYAIYEMAKK